MQGRRKKMGPILTVKIGVRVGLDAAEAAAFQFALKGLCERDELKCLLNVKCCKKVCT